jgi:hypothetical protein
MASYPIRAAWYGWDAPAARGNQGQGQGEPPAEPPGQEPAPAPAPPPDAPRAVKKNASK